MAKIIQIALAQSDVAGGELTRTLIALTSDGDLWTWNEDAERWYGMPTPDRQRKEDRENKLEREALKRA